MKFIKWRFLIVTCVVCLLPILLGLALWENLPDTMAIHFDINNNPDNFAPKAFAVFGMPMLMVVLQVICCIINDVNAYKHGERKKFSAVTKSIVPFLSVVLQTVTLGYALGWNIDIRKFVCVIVGVILVVIGNYLPKLDYVKNADVDTEKARKINRFLGFENVVMGLLMIVSIFFPPFASVVCLVLIIPYVIIGVVYGIVVGRK